MNDLEEHKKRFPDSYREAIKRTQFNFNEGGYPKYTILLKVSGYFNQVYQPKHLINFLNINPHA